ncbi:MAG: hypothetical protein ACLFRB_11345, partial [Thiohalorhabdus sp.]
AGLWLAGRLAGPLGTGGLMVSGTADLAFMVALVIALARPIMAADQLRQQSGVLHPRTGRAWSLRWSPSPPWCG